MKTLVQLSDGEGVDLGVLDPCIEIFSGGLISRHVLLVITEVQV